MRKIKAILKTELQRQMTYRLNFFGFRLANIVEISTQLIIWSIIFQKADMIRGYSYNEMMSYVLISWLILFLTSSYGYEDNISKDIYLGRLGNYLLKPMSYLKYTIIVSFGRVVIALLTAVLLMAVIIMVLHNYLIAPPSLIHIVLMLPMIMAGFFSRLFMAILAGFIGFWTTEVQGIYKFIDVLIKFFSGSYFPVNLLPALLLKISFFFPFIYNIYIPTQLYLGKITIIEGIKGFGVQIIWLFLLYLIIKLVWKFGIKKYENVGA
jgi:ABC-2 type transport system permease protein